MSHLTTTQEQWDADPTDLVVVVEGEPHTIGGRGHGRQTFINAPAFLMAATQPCKTCDGDGVEYLGDDDDIGDACSADCHEGHPVSEVRAECPTCDGTGHYLDDRGEAYEDTCMADDCCVGTVLLGRVTVTAVVPIPYVDGRFAVRCKKVPT